MYFPLHLYSQYSFLESGILLEKFLSIVYKNNVKCIALTDKNILMGLPEFDKLSKKYNIKPIFGMDLIIENVLFTFLIKNEDGYKNLSKLSLLFSSNELTLLNFKENIDGLVVILCSSSPLFNNINDEFKNKVSSIARSINPDDFYIGLEFFDESLISHYELIRNFANKFCYKTIAHSLTKYIKKDDAIVLDILNAIKNNTKLDISYKPNKSFYHLKTDEELKKFYTTAELDSINEIVNKINFELNKKRGEMLHYPIHDGENNSENELIKKIKEGLIYRKIDLNTQKIYRNRLNYEFKIIKQMGYCDYFLIVQDYVNYAKTHNIPVGPGRGSAAGCLISYVLNITEVDPIKYNLLFERFLNPSRQSMPDIDIDFGDTKRDLVVIYLKEKYGLDRVANIATIQTILAKQALRDIGRIYSFEDKDVSELTKLIIDKNNKQVNLVETYKNNSKFKNIVDDDEKIKTLVKRAHLIEGLARQRGMHAAGVILNNTPLINSIPLFKDNIGYITQYEKDYLEEEGFLKMDILGLINLTTIDNTLKLIKFYKNIDVDLKNIDLDNPKIYEPIQKELLMGVFQMDTSAASSALNYFKPRNFSELTAFISLDRPGPRVNLGVFANRLNGKEEVTYIDNSLIHSLKDTYGIFIYQEQIMIASQDFAGFTFAEADNLRKACSKKDKTKMEAMKAKFISGALKKGHKVDVINKVFETISKFAEYGFNKSHAVAYAMITAQTLYLKSYYPMEFYTAILNSQITKNDEKLSKYIIELKKSNINLKVPNINISRDYYVPEGNNIYMPFNLIDKINANVSESIIKERDENGKYVDFYNFVLRLNKLITQPQISKLIDAGTFDSLHNNRQELKKTIIHAINYANCPLQEDVSTERYYEKADDDIDMRLDFEKDALGIVLSQSIIERYAKNIKDIVLKNYEDLKENEIANILVLYTKAKKIKTKNGKDMCFLDVKDDFNTFSCTVFSDTYEKYIDVINNLKEGYPIIVEGKLSRNYKNNELIFIVNSIRKVDGELCQK